MFSSDKNEFFLGPYVLSPSCSNHAPLFSSFSYSATCQDALSPNEDDEREGDGGLAKRTTSGVKSQLTSKFLFVETSAKDPQVSTPASGKHASS